MDWVCVGEQRKPINTNENKEKKARKLRLDQPKAHCCKKHEKAESIR